MRDYSHEKTSRAALTRATKQPFSHPYSAKEIKHPLRKEITRTRLLVKHASYRELGCHPSFLNNHSRTFPIPFSSLTPTIIMATATDNVAQLYGKIATSEGSRLAEHPMERELTLRTIRAHVPPAPAAVADIGGGPGKLAFALADDGHLVDLVDLTPDLIAMAQAEQDSRRAAPASSGRRLLQSISVGNALHTPSSMPTGSYDGVLLLGPLYHLLEEDERAAAVRNALQLARPGTGVVFCAFVSIAAHLRDIAMRNPAKLLGAQDFYSKYVSADVIIRKMILQTNYAESSAMASTIPSRNHSVSRSKATTPAPPTLVRSCKSTLPMRQSLLRCVRQKAFSVEGWMPS